MTHPISRLTPSVHNLPQSESYQAVDVAPRDEASSNQPISAGNETLLVPDYSLKDNLPVTWTVVTPPASHAASPQDDRPSREEAEEFFHVFQTHMLGNLPFIIFPRTMTAKQLQKEQPFLWLCIMAVASNSSSQKAALGREIRITLGKEVWLESRNSLDIVLGLLTYLNWYVNACI